MAEAHGFAGDDTAVPQAAVPAQLSTKPSSLLSQIQIYGSSPTVLSSSVPGTGHQRKGKKMGLTTQQRKERKWDLLLSKGILCFPDCLKANKFKDN